MAGRKCVQCSRDLGYHLLCPYCRELNAPEASEDHFALLGIPRSYDVDPALLEARFLELSRELHPDYFQDRPELRARSVFLSATLNDAFDVLKDAFRRAEYLVAVLGGPSSSADKRLPSGYLVEMMELREEIDAARGERGDAALAPYLRDLEERRAGVVASLAAKFRSLLQAPPLDGGVPHEGVDRESMLASIRQELNAANYLNSLRRDLLGKR